MAIGGFWTAEFGSSVGIFGGGVVFFQDGKVTGGDNAYFYAGTYEENGPKFRGTILVKPFIRGISSVFNTVNEEFTLDLDGVVESPTRLVAQGQRRDMPGVTFGVKLTKRG